MKFCNKYFGTKKKKLKDDECARFVSTLSVCKNSKKVYTFSVSSVLGHEVEQFGKQFLFDREPETAWSSDAVFERKLFYNLL